MYDNVNENTACIDNVFNEELGGHSDTDEQPVTFYVYVRVFVIILRSLSFLHCTSSLLLCNRNLPLQQESTGREPDHIHVYVRAISHYITPLLSCGGISQLDNGDLWHV